MHTFMEAYRGGTWNVESCRGRKMIMFSIDFNYHPCRIFRQNLIVACSDSSFVKRTVLEVRVLLVSILTHEEKIKYKIVTWDEGARF